MKHTLLLLSILTGFSLFSSPIHAEVDAAYKRDLGAAKKSSSGEWADGSESGRWSIGYVKSFYDFKSPEKLEFSSKRKCFGDRKEGVQMNLPDHRGGEITLGPKDNPHTAVITWTSDVKAQVHVSGLLGKPLGGGDGMKYHMYHVPAEGEQKLIYATESGGGGRTKRPIRGEALSYLSIQPGDKLVMVIGPGDAGNSIRDGAVFVEDLVISTNH